MSPDRRHRGGPDRPGRTGLCRRRTGGVRHQPLTSVDHRSSNHTNGSHRHMADMSPQPSVFDRLLRDRIIWLGSEVRDENANEIAAKLLLLAAEDSDRDIYLYINSPGGSITAGMAVYDTMQFVSNDNVTVGIRNAGSVGAPPLSPRPKGER